MGDVLTRATIRLSLIAFAIGCWRLGRIAEKPKVDSLGITAWYAGVILFWLHVACAFHFFHDWNHARAYENVQRQSEAMFGVAVGWGLYFNYLFGISWLIDAMLLSLGSPQANLQRYLRYRAGLLAFLLFLWFNGAIVFATGFVRWLAIGLAILAAVQIAVKWRTRTQHDSSPSKPFDVE